MSSVPIPQGATIEQASAPSATAVPIPQNAIVEQQAGKGVTTDSMDADYQFKHPALTDEENQQLKAANLSRPIYRKLLGLPANDPAAGALEAKDQAHQTESAQHSSYVAERFKDHAKAEAILASTPALVAATVPAAGAAASTIATLGPPLARLAASPAAQAVIKEGGKYALKTAASLLTTYGGGKLGAALGVKWLQRIFD